MFTPMDTPLYMYLHLIYTVYTPNTPLNTPYTPYIHHYIHPLHGRYTRDITTLVEVFVTPILKVCLLNISVYIQSIFSLYSVYIQSMFSLCSVYVQYEDFANLKRSSLHPS